MPTLVVPRGGLVSWNGFSFRANRSKLQQGWTVKAAGQHRVQAGTLLSVDGYAGGVAPVDYILPYEYKIASGFGDDVNYPQAHLDALMAAYSTSQVGTLVCHKQGNTGSTVSGSARLEEIAETSGDPFTMTLSLVFYVEAGMA